MSVTLFSSFNNCRQHRQIHSIKLSTKKRYALTMLITRVPQYNKTKFNPNWLSTLPILHELNETHRVSNLSKKLVNHSQNDQDCISFSCFKAIVPKCMNGIAHGEIKNIRITLFSLIRSHTNSHIKPDILVLFLIFFLFFYGEWGGGGAVCFFVFPH